MQDAEISGMEASYQGQDSMQDQGFHVWTLVPSE